MGDVDELAFLTVGALSFDEFVADFCYEVKSNDGSRNALKGKRTAIVVLHKSHGLIGFRECAS